MKFKEQRKERASNPTKVFLTIAVVALMIVIGFAVVAGDRSASESAPDDSVSPEELIERLESIDESPIELSGGYELFDCDVYISGQKTIIGTDGGFTIEINQNSKLEIGESGSLTIGAGVNVVNYGSIENLGTINIICVDGPIEPDEESVGVIDNMPFDDFGSILNIGYFYNDGTILNQGSIVNDGRDGSKIVNYNTITNNFAITNRGTFTNHDTFTNNNLVVNDGKINNNGVFVNATEGEFSGEGTLYNYNVMSGEFGCNVVDDGNQFDLVPVTISPGRSTVQASSTSAIQFTASPGFSVNDVIKIGIGDMAMAINGGELVGGMPVNVVMAKSNITTSTVGGTEFDVSFTGLKNGATVKITLPATGPNCTVHHLVDGVSVEKMEILNYTGNSVTFNTNHNSRYAVVSYGEATNTHIADDTNTAFMLSIFGVVVSLVAIAIVIQRR